MHGASVVHSLRPRAWLARVGRDVRAKGGVNAIPLDNAGDIVVPGQADCEGALSKYSTSGQTLRDRRLSAQSSGMAALYFAAVDAKDNIYVAGRPGPPVANPACQTA